MPVSAAQCSDLLKKLEAALPKVDMASARRAAARIRKRAVQEFTRTGVGRRIWGQQAARGKARSRERSLRVVIPGARVKADGSGLLITHKLQGIAALVEKGGRTAPHGIKAWRGARLAFLGRARGHLVRPKAVRHPGSQFPTDAFARRAWDASLPDIKAELDAGRQVVADLMFGKGGAR